MTRPRFLSALWPRTRISTHLLFFFLCISLIPCGLLTALTLFISARSLLNWARPSSRVRNPAPTKAIARPWWARAPAAQG